MQSVRFPKSRVTSSDPGPYINRRQPVAYSSRTSRIDCEPRVKSQVPSVFMGAFIAFALIETGQVDPVRRRHSPAVAQVAFRLEPVVPVTGRNTTTLLIELVRAAGDLIVSRFDRGALDWRYRRRRRRQRGRDAGHLTHPCGILTTSLRSGHGCSLTVERSEIYRPLNRLVCQISTFGIPVTVMTL